MPLHPYPIRSGLGGVLLALGAFWTFVSLVFLFMPDMRGAAPANLGLALFVFALPGALLWTSGRARRQRIERMEAVVGALDAAGRSRVEDVARAVGLPIDRARQAVLDGVLDGRLAGRLDLGTDTFVPAADAADARPQEQAVLCSRCGATSTVVVTSGEPAVCRYCGAAG